MANSHRPNFLKATAIAGGALGLTAFGVRTAQASVPQFGGDIPGFGPLLPTASANTGEVLLKLPQGFKYNVLIRNGNIMADGRPFPSNVDGMAAFEYNGSVRLVACHERGAGTPIGSLPWDPKAGGGTTTHTFDPQTRLLTESFVSSSGTVRNCAGGCTPWGSFLTCEESNLGPSATLDRQHGYIYEVPANADSEIAAEPLVNMGLHYPEAAVVDPRTSMVYPAGRSVEREALFQVKVHCQGAWPFRKRGRDQHGHPLRDLPGTGNYQVELFKQHDLDGHLPVPLTIIRFL